MTAFSLKFALGLPGTVLTFFIAASLALCFAFEAKPVLIMMVWMLLSSACRTSNLLLSSPLRLGVDKRLEGAEPEQLTPTDQGSVPNNMVMCLSI